MKYTIALLLVLFPIFNFAQGVRVQRAYIKRDGTYVQPHVKTNVDKTNHNNLNTKPNYNPYRGSEGTVPKDYSPDAYRYGQGQQIRTGSNGGQYYINSNGNKTYVPKRR